jgi:D-serine deaminase-like pyridoxal phosphate-dependent protein
MKITRPTLLLDKSRCLENLDKMIQKAKNNKIELRPHFKTHQSHQVGRWFRENGIRKIATSSLRMAEYFAKDGWDDITVAFPANILEIDLINRLAESIELNLLIQSRECLNFLSDNLKNQVNGLIKIDLGYGRTGLRSDDFDGTDELIKEMNKSSNIKFSGFLGHAGHSYDARGIEQIKAVHNEACSKMQQVFDNYKDEYPDITISMGDTPTCSAMNSFGSATEIRPGNFVFYDLVQQQIGSCTLEQIAVAVACPVVALHPERNEIIIYGGGVHFSKDVYKHDKYGKCYGLVVGDAGKAWSGPVEDVFLQKISQEHGVVSCTDEFMEQCKIGDVLKILPVHSCMTADLLKRMLTIEGVEIEMMGNY